MADIADWLLASQDPFYDEHDEDCEYGGSQPSYAYARRQLACKRCGSTDVRWRQQGGGWALFSSTPGVEHNCVTDADFTPAP